MPLTCEYLRYIPAGTSNIIASANSNLIAINENVIAVGACEKVIFWNLRKGEKVGEICGEKLVTVCEYSQEKYQVAIGHCDGIVKLFHVRNYDEPLLTFSGHKNAVSALCFSPDSLLLASGGKDRIVIVWDIVNECGLYRLNGHKGPVTKLNFVQDGAVLVSSSKDSFVKFWDLNSQHCFHTIADHRTEVWDFVLVKEDTVLLIGCGELELYLYSLSWPNGDKNFKWEVKEEVSDEVSRKNARLDTPEYGKQNGTLAASETYKYFKVTVECKRLGSLLRQSKGRVSQLLVSPDERLIVCLGVGNTADIYRIFDAAETEKRIQKKLKKAQKRHIKDETEESHVSALPASYVGMLDDLSTQFVRLGDVKVDSKMKSVAFASPVSKTVAKYKVWFMLANNLVEEYNLSVDGKNLAATFSDSLKSQGHRTQIRAVAFSSDSASILTGSQEEIKLWNRNSLLCIRTLSCSDVLALLSVPGDKHCIAGTKKGDLCLFDLANGECLETVRGHQGAVWSLSLAHDEKSFASCSEDKSIKFWNFDLLLENNRSRLTLVNTRILEITDEALSVCFTGNGRLISVGLLDNTAKVYFTDSLKFFLCLYGHSLPVLCLDCSSDSKLIVTGSADKNVKIWGLDFGDCHRSLFAHDDSVTCVKFLPKTHYFFSAGKDGMIKQWDADKFQKIQVLKGHHNEVWALAMSKSGLFLASASHDRTLRLWERSEELLILQEEQEVEREEDYEKALTEQEDVIPGESGGESGLAAKKTLDTVKSAENIIEAVEICRSERLARVEDSEHKEHPMVTALGSSSLDFFVMDIVKSVRSSDLEKCLLSVPFTYILDILRALTACVERRYNIELGCRVIFFLLRVHQNQLVNSTEAVSVLDKLHIVLPAEVAFARDIIGVNLAALKLLRIEIEEREGVQLFEGATERFEARKKKKNRLSEAYVMSVN